jgi:hypothetical protein
MTKAINILTLAYKAFCVAILLLLFFGAIGMIDKGRYYDAAFGSVTFVVIAYYFR